ncbi:MAG: thiamine-phosphate kinase, partial [Acidimicrobiales bacterium]
MTCCKRSEEQVLSGITQLLGSPPQDQVWAGDDCAVLPSGQGQMLLAADLLAEGVHFDLSLVGLDDVGWKALAVNLSDIAAMAGTPGHAVVSVAAPAGTDFDLLYSGLVEAGDAFGCPVVGGDLSLAASRTGADRAVPGDAPGRGTGLVVSVAVTGWSRQGPPVLRSGARPGDALLVTGALGASAAGLSELRRCHAAAGS